ncbi:hypothetical protein [Curtobacterium sp. MMLR14_010]|uniref:hypothetical protein n=1 Tax=Curtobacterium sp. MMLR14_010 TaxID=1898743 RepID=UPI001587D2CA|nr:hypothetical protein [Curtobacterium sp. MMLR14_010]
MTTDQDVTEAQRTAQVALFRRIEDMAERATNAVSLGYVARAYRSAAGGPQPSHNDTD